MGNITSLPYTANFSAFTNVAPSAQQISQNNTGWSTINAMGGEKILDILDNSSVSTYLGYFSEAFKSATGNNYSIKNDELRLPFYHVGPNCITIMACPNGCHYKCVDDATDKGTNNGVTSAYDYPLYLVFPESDIDLSYAQLSFGLGFADYDYRQLAQDGNKSGGELTLQPTGDVHVGYLTNPADASTWVEIPGVLSKGVVVHVNAYEKDWLGRRTDYTWGYNVLNPCYFASCFEIKSSGFLGFTKTGSIDMTKVPIINVNLGLIPAGARLAFRVDTYHPANTNHFSNGQSNKHTNAHIHGIVIKNIHIDKATGQDGLYGITTRGTGENARTDDYVFVHADPAKVMNVSRDITLSTVANPTARPTDYVTVTHEYPLTGTGSFSYNGTNYTVPDAQLANLPAEMFRGMELNGGLVVKLPANGKYSTIGEAGKVNATFSDIDNVVLLAPGNPGSVNFATSAGSSYTGFQPATGALTLGYLGRGGTLSQSAPAGINSTARYASYPYSVEFDNGVNPEDFDILRPFEHPTAAYNYHLHIRPKATASTTTFDDSDFNNDGTVHIVSGTSYSCHDGVHEDTDNEPSGEFDGTLEGEGDAHVLSAKVYARIPDGHNSQPQTITGEELFRVDSLVIDCNQYNTNNTGWSVASVPNSGIDNAITTNTDIRIRHTIDNLRYYWIAQPFDVALADVVAKDADGHVVPRATVEPEQITDYSHDYWVIYEYNEAERAADGTLNNYRLVTDGTLQANRGYAVTVVESDAHYDPNKTVQDQVPVTLTLPSGRGQKTIGTTAYTGHTIGHVTHTGNNWWSGWNLVGNPFLHAINGSAYGQYINVHDYNSNNVTDVKQIHTGLYDHMVQPFTAISMQVGNADPIAIILGNTSDPEVQSAPAYRPEHFTITATLGSHADHTTVIANNEASAEYVVGEDLSKIDRSGVSLYTTADGIRYAYNERPVDEDTLRIPLGLRADAAGDVLLALDADHTDFDGVIILHDTEDGTYTDLASGSTITRTVTAGRTDSRFEILVSRIPLAISDVQSGDELRACVVNGRLVIDGSLDRATVTIYDASGRMLHSEQEVSGTVDYTFSERGVYMVTIRTEEGVRTMKVVF